MPITYVRAVFDKESIYLQSDTRRDSSIIAIAIARSNPFKYIRIIFMTCSPAIVHPWQQSVSPPKCSFQVNSSISKMSLSISWYGKLHLPFVLLHDCTRIRLWSVFYKHRNNSSYWVRRITKVNLPATKISLLNVINPREKESTLNPIRDPSLRCIN